MLYIVSTPIGNLKDISIRAIDVLKAVDIIAAEDTRHTRKLTVEYGINTRLTSYFEHNKFSKGEYLLGCMKEGKDVALVTDAGTPGISDPGYHLIRLADTHGIPVSVVPGATALIAGLTLSGFPSHNFVFEGFLPVKSPARRKKLGQFKDEARTIIFYESPYRLLKMLQDIEDILDNPHIACVREITKKFEEVKKGRACEVRAYFSEKKPKGEFVVLVNQALASAKKDIPQ